MGLGAWEIGLIVLAVVILFGTKKLPELGAGLGKAISNFKKSYRDSSEIDVTPADQKGASEQKQGGEQNQK